MKLFVSSFDDYGGWAIAANSKMEAVKKITDFLLDNEDVFGDVIDNCGEPKTWQFYEHNIADSADFERSLGASELGNGIWGWDGQEGTYEEYYN